MSLHLDKCQDEAAKLKLDRNFSLRAAGAYHQCPHMVESCFSVDLTPSRRCVLSLPIKVHCTFQLHYPRKKLQTCNLCKTCNN
jgi:hypothetical protein